MASFQVVGFIESIKYIPNNGGCFVFVSEFKKGYRKSSGEVVDDRNLQWKIIFKQGLVKYINDHFNNGMLVEVKGEVFPYAVEHGNVTDGYSVIGQTMNMFSFPRSYARSEEKMIKESMLHSDEKPNLSDFNSPDF